MTKFLALTFSLLMVTVSLAGCLGNDSDEEELEFDESKTFRLSQSDKDVMKQINKIRDKAFKFSTGSKEHTALMRQMDMQKSKLSKDAQRSLMMGETIEDELGERTIKLSLIHI